MNTLPYGMLTLFPSSNWCIMLGIQKVETTGLIQENNIQDDSIKTLYPWIYKGTFLPEQEEARKCHLLISNSTIIFPDSSHSTCMDEIWPRQRWRYPSEDGEWVHKLTIIISTLLSWLAYLSIPIWCNYFKHNKPLLLFTAQSFWLKRLFSLV